MKDPTLTLLLLTSIEEPAEVISPYRSKEPPSATEKLFPARVSFPEEATTNFSKTMLPGEAVRVSSPVRVPEILVTPEVAV